MISVFPEYDLFIAPDGEQLIFNRLSDRFLQSFDGSGMSPIKYVEQQGALQHGTTIYDYKLQRRVIQWTIRQNGCDRWDYWEKRALFLDVLRPNRHAINDFGPGTLRKVLPNGDIRDIDHSCGANAKTACISIRFCTTGTMDDSFYITLIL